MPPFFHHLFIPFSCFINQAILFINMHEEASAWLQGEGDDMTTVGPRIAGMGAGRHLICGGCVYAHRQFQPPPFFI